MNQDSIAVYALQAPWQWNLTWADFTERFVQPEKVTEINITQQNRGDWLHCEIDVTSQVHQWRQSPEHNHGVAQRTRAGRGHSSGASPAPTGPIARTSASCIG